MNNKPEKKPVDLGLGELAECEQRLILAIRHKYRFADVLIKTRHGLPYRLVLTERFEDFNSDSYADKSVMSS